MMPAGLARLLARLFPKASPTDGWRLRLADAWARRRTKWSRHVER